MIGQTISHYRIIEKLGEGGMGVVYKAEDMLLHRTVALKFPSEPFVRNEGMRTRLLTEARLAARLLHQNVTVVHGVGEHEGKPYMVMEFVDGLSLGQMIREDGPLPAGKAVAIAIQTCEGLKAVHDREVLHRDIKAENILLTDACQVKIADCGLAARFMSDEGPDKEPGVAGTTGYMSPEQIRGEPLDPRSDIFSVGVVLYEMLTGHLPFEAAHASASMYLVLHSDPTPLQTYREDVPPALDHIVRRALEKDPDKRYQNVADMINALQQVAQALCPE